MWASILGVVVLALAWLYLDYQLKEWKLRQRERSEKIVLLGDVASKHLMDAIEAWHTDSHACMIALMTCIEDLRASCKKTSEASASTKDSTNCTEVKKEG